jgi:hypothetical protein
MGTSFVGVDARHAADTPRQAFNCSCANRALPAGRVDRAIFVQRAAARRTQHAQVVEHDKPGARLGGAAIRLSIYRGTNSAQIRAL